MPRLQHPGNTNLTPEQLNPDPIPTAQENVVILRCMRFHTGFTEPRWAPILFSTDGVAFHFDLALLAEVSRWFSRLQHLPSLRTPFAQEPVSMVLPVGNHEALAIILNLVRDDHLYRTGMRNVPPIPVTHPSPEVRVNLLDICWAYEFSELITWYMPHPAWSGPIEGPTSDQTEHNALVDRSTAAAARMNQTFDYNP